MSGSPGREQESQNPAEKELSRPRIHDPQEERSGHRSRRNIFRRFRTRPGEVSCEDTPTHPSATQSSTSLQPTSASLGSEIGSTELPLHRVLHKMPSVSGIFGTVSKRLRSETPKLTKSQRASHEGERGITESHRVVRLRWREAHSLEDFAQLAGWGPDLVESIRPMFTPYGTVEEFVRQYGSMYIGKLINAYKNRRDLSLEVNLSAMELLSVESNIDELAAALAETAKILHIWKQDRFEDYHRVFLQLYPSSLAQQSVDWRARVSNALLTALQRERIGRDQISEIWNMIVACFEKYESTRVFSPYTSIIGSTGCGKTSTVENFARAGKCYVSYANLAARGEFTVPKRSIMADRIAEIEDRAELTIFFEVYIASALEQVVLCRRTGITAYGFWQIQVLQQFEDLQTDIADHVHELFQLAKLALEQKITGGRPPTPDISRKLRERVRSGNNARPPSQGILIARREYIDALLPDHRDRMRETFAKASKRLEENMLMSPDENAALREGHLECLICLDEASDLFRITANETIDGSRYGAWRRAFRHRATTENKESKQLNFFGLVTGTTSRVSYLSPSKRWDQSLSSASSPYDLFPPIWELDTFDNWPNDHLYDIKNLPVYDDKLDNKYYKDLFTFGRPLWGALLEDEKMSAEDVKGLIQHKISDFRSPSAPGLHEQSRPNETDHVRSLALLSYRIMFFINLESLAEELSSTYLHFIADVSDDRALVRTLQPSEPILAWVASQEMQMPRKRVAVVRSIHYHIQRGFINIGDVGEVVAAMILLFALDKANGIGRPRPVSLAKFFKCLLPERLCGKIQPICERDSKLGEIWEGSVFFSQFVRTQNNDRAVTIEVLTRAYARNAALIAPNNFEGCDLIIPIVVVKKNGKKDELYPHSGEKCGRLEPYIWD
ncbi:hypothetical protein AWENTII_009480 [Aspergillus wentii]